ncbi:L-2,4-diaminobutyrate decarboxylase [Novipirellula aureliae]|uniref:L-2,4-diaminobutyrate decarboxylase n=1 Tax=Novipirellula aureliae TaxID=2527966 RepID=A0A5C6E889_9BACT|nr:pyridoxal-dependent decarboxylase [Novipirellula aureliae]TWU45028.1 L-2,4-diaminobutyrate decarboxylase [Novipirellula aureliae]
MDQAALKKLTDTFFTFDRESILQIFDEFLSAMEAESHLPPGSLMSRNYETAQANPEIHTLPGNLKDARDAIFPYFWGTDGWQSRLHLENVKGPANNASLIGALACLLKNPNLCVDTYCLRSNELEVKAITALANLIFYHTDSPWGVFTMGGTISNLYGGKLGIEKVAPATMQKGLAGEPISGIVSETGHYSNATLAGWLGMGTENLHTVATDNQFSMRLDLLAEKIDWLYDNGRKIAFVIATFGSTDAYGIDDIRGIRELIRRKAAERGVAEPHLHVDAAVGWVSSFLAEYDIETNRLQVEHDTLQAIGRLKRATEGFAFADSVTIDFHKMGWGHYPSSAFIVNRREDLGRLLRSVDQMPYFCEADCRHDPALFTLECSRPGLGPYAVMASLNGIGLQGYQTLVANAMQMAIKLKKAISELEYCKVLNMDTIGPSVLFWVLPRGRDANAIYERLERGELSPNEVERTLFEVHRMYEKREATLQPAVDAKLSYTQSTGYKPHGIAIPAWKAAFFNPKSDEAVIAQVVESIERVA